VQEDEKGVGCKVGEVVGGELLERLGHGRRVGDGLCSEAVGVVLEFAG